MSGYLLDTSVVIDFLRGRDEVIVDVNSLDLPINSSYIVLCELKEGIHRVVQSERKTVQSALKEHFSNYNSVFGLNEEVCERFGEIRAKLRVSGQMIEDLDILIAATAIVNDQILVTKNAKHFERVEELEIKPI